MLPMEMLHYYAQLIVLNDELALLDIQPAATTFEPLGCIQTGVIE